MRASLVVTGPARSDLLSIWEYLLHHCGVNVADRVIADIRSMFEKIAVHPDIGSFREDLTTPGQRFRRIHSYYVVYRHGTKSVVILRVIHTSRDVRGILGEDNS